jgi:hypothetical protein
MPEDMVLDQDALAQASHKAWWSQASDEFTDNLFSVMVPGSKQVAAPTVFYVQIYDPSGRALDSVHFYKRDDGLNYYRSIQLSPLPDEYNKAIEQKNPSWRRLEDT